MNSASLTTRLPETGSLAPWLTLEILTGKTQFPHRPVTGVRYSIGAGPRCDLQLGGSGLPDLHTLIQFRGQHIWVEPVTSEHLLLLNGEATEGEWLRDGDLLQIGSFRFQAHIVSVRPAAYAALAGQDSVEEETLDLSQQTVDQLVEQLTADIDLVEQDSVDRNAGAQAMIQAIRRRQPQRSALPGTAQALLSSFQLPVTGERSEGVLLAELEQLCRDLDTFTQELEQRSVQLALREENYAIAAEELLGVQQSLLQQIETLLQQVSTARDQSQTTRSRASA